MAWETTSAGWIFLCSDRCQKGHGDADRESLSYLEFNNADMKAARDSETTERIRSEEHTEEEVWHPTKSFHYIRSGSIIECSLPLLLPSRQTLKET